MEHAGITRMLSRLLRPLLHRVFPSTKEDAALAGSLSANICANFLGLGNAATPMGIQAAQRMKRGGTATDELCRLIVLNTASIQLIPANVAAVRSALGCATPFDILPAVWVTSLCSAGLGVTAAWVPVSYTHLQRGHGEDFSRLAVHHQPERTVLDIIAGNGSRKLLFKARLHRGVQR